MTQEVSDFIPRLLEDRDKHIEVADGHHVTAKQKGQAQIKICDDNGDPFIATLHNLLLASDLCDILFSIITLMNLVQNCLSHKGFYTLYLGAKEKNAVTLPHSAQRKHASLGKIKEMSKTEKLPSRKNIALKLLQQRLGNILTRSFLAGYNDNVWEDIDLRIYSYPFCTSCHISSMNKKAGSKNPLNPKAPFKWVFMDIIPSTVPNSLTSETTYYNYLLIVDAYFKIPKLYGMEKISTEQVTDKMDMFQYRFGKIDEFGWWDLETTSADTGKQFNSMEFKEEYQTTGVHWTLAAPGHQKMNEKV